MMPSGTAVDPLHSLFGPSLFTRTIVRAPTDSAMPSDPKDLDSVHHFMKSVTLRSPEKLSAAGKDIVDRGPELMNSEFEKFAQSVGIDKDAFQPGGIEKPRERRPGLGLNRPRPRFTFKPSTDKSSVILEPSLDIDSLQDPEEFWAAFEKAENAKKEIQRRLGITDDSVNFDVSPHKRARRPGLLGKRLSYKHRYSSSSVLLESRDEPILSQEMLEPEILAATSSVADAEIQETDVAGSITMTEKRVNGILDEFISGSMLQDLGADEAVSLLQERFKINPIGKTSVPSYQGVKMADFIALDENLPNVRRTLSNISNLVKQFSGESSLNHNIAADISMSPLASPTPLKSPFASLSLLKKRITHSTSLGDPFSPYTVDSMGHRNPAGSQINLVDKGCGDTSIESANECNTSMGAETLLTDSNECNTSRGAENNDSANGTEKQTEKVGDMYESAGTSVENDSMQVAVDAALRIHASTEVEGKRSEATIHAFPDANMDRSFAKVDMNESQPLSDQLNTAATEDNSVVTPSTSADINAKKKPKQQNLRAEEQRKAKRPSRDIRDMQALSRRKSIQEAGTSFVSGIRRSKRIKTRPLEYWKGERLLYGHINGSLKLIGLKYISPSKGEGQLKVKSYVPDEMIEVAAQI